MTLMKPLNLWSWSHQRSVEMMRINMVALESGRADGGCGRAGEGER